METGVAKFSNCMCIVGFDFSSFTVYLLTQNGVYIDCETDFIVLYAFYFLGNLFIFKYDVQETWFIHLPSNFICLQFQYLNSIYKNTNFGMYSISSLTNVIWHHRITCVEN